MPITDPIQCVKCSATGTKALADNNIADIRDGWMKFEGVNHAALNRTIYICAGCGKGVHEQKSMLATVGK